MGNKNWWAMIVITMMVVMACGGQVASLRPSGTAGPSATTAEPTDAEPTDAEPTDAEPTDAEPTDAEPTDAEPTDAEPSPTDAEPSPTDAEPSGEPTLGLPTVPTGYTELDQALGADKPLNGKRVTIQTQWIGGEGANFDATVSAFEAATGIDIVQESIASQHEVVLRTRIDGGTPPDLAMLAQPSAVVAYGDRGAVVNVTSFMDAAKIDTEFDPNVIANVTDDAGNIWGIPFKVDVKSTIWYPIKAFENAGYEVPATWAELQALSAQIVADGNGNPWCIGMLDGAATGWIATDWVEDVMLRTAGIDAYNRWVSHDLLFDSPEVRAALDVLREQWFTENYVYGTYQAITATDRLEGWDPMFAPDNNWDGFTPGCWMHRQATWIGPDFFPDKRANSDPTYQSMYVLDEDIGMFYLPPIDEAQGSPVLVAGDTLLVPTPAGGAEVRPEVKAVAQFLSTPYGPKAWIDIGSGIAANTTTPTDWYASYKQDVAFDLVANADSVGFDASDLMPPAVGAGTFWSKMVEWIDAGGTNTDQILADIDASWPSQ